MHSPNLKKVEEYLVAKKFTFASSFHVQPNADHVLVSVPESVIGPKSTVTTTTRRRLESLKKKIAADLGISVEFLLVKGAVQCQIEAGLKALVSAKFSERINEAFLSFSADGCYDVWLEQAEGADGDVSSEKEVRSALEAYLKMFGAKIGLVLSTTAESKIPTFGQILREAKRLAPTAAEALLNALQTSGFKVPSRSWIERKLDTLRKRHLLIRFRDGRYSLTEAGLATVPHSKTRTSSDVERALALGRRKW